MTGTCRASGIGSWPGDDIGAALTTVRDLLADDDLPYLPELPARGPGADLIGRGAALLVGLPVDLQPSGWRFVDRPGRDLHRARAFLRRDLDELAEAFDGYTGSLKVQAAGPWTLAASVQLNRGERAVVDEGACRDLTASLAEGLRDHLEAVARLVPNARVVIQLDEPSLPAVLAGRLPTASGYGRLRAVDPSVAADGLRTALEAVRDRADQTVIHCCDRAVPLPLLRSTGADAIALDATALDARGWESVAATVESGTDVWLGTVATDGASQPTVREVVERTSRSWHDVGMPATQLGGLTVTPACGLASAATDGAARIQRLVRDVARALAETAAGA
ncbi:MAG TPA: methionine synthase [Segeticoccus sp.]|uniref:methionine synthase n=1 Tax=Segeticoccus sp. TaxID=2706531 RepID=UPI002D7E75E0|nr:methionine synthase [Segeticoccus sp.]HET8600827.1 methionine synthase [Segeticoccus sp.]